MASIHFHKIVDLLAQSLAVQQNKKISRSERERKKRAAAAVMECNEKLLRWRCEKLHLSTLIWGKTRGVARRGAHTPVRLTL